MHPIATRAAPIAMLTFIASKRANSPHRGRARHVFVRSESSAGPALVPPLSWDRKLDLSENEADVVRVIEDYLATLDHCEIALLPARCRPRKLSNARDIGAYAFDLATHCSEEEDAMASLVHRLANLFAHACLRLSRLA